MSTPIGELDVLQSLMADDALIRRENFNRLFPVEKFQGADLVRLLGKSPSYWSELRSGKKSFGEKVAG